MRCTSQHEGCIACMSLWWPFFVPTGSMQIASGLEQGQSSSAERFGKTVSTVEAIGVKSCWLHVPARPDFVEPSVFHFQYLLVLVVLLFYCIKWCFLQNRLCLRFWWWAWKQSYVSHWQSPSWCFELEQSDSQKAYGFDCLAYDTTDKMD